MSFLPESSTFESGVYQLEITDAVIGGANGLSNLQAKQLANRTNWLNGNKQDKDALLSSIAALTTAADKLIYATGADTFSTTTLTAFARTLLDDVDAATMRTTLGAQAAGSYQAADATLAAIAALTTAADKLIYATGADTFSTTTLTAFARTLLDDVDAATMRGTIGAGSLSTDAISLTENGYMKLSNGLIIQWGKTGSIAAGGNVIVTLPISFPNVILNAQVSNTGTSDISLHVNTITASSITIRNMAAAAAYNNQTAQSGSWLVLGY